MKHGGEGSVIMWACMAANGTGSIVLIDDVTNESSRQFNVCPEQQPLLRFSQMLQKCKLDGVSV